MIQEELIAMSQKERDRLQVLHEAKQRQITQKEAGEQIGVSERWVRKLLARMRKQGDRAVVHRLRGRRSNRKIARRADPGGEEAGRENDDPLPRTLSGRQPMRPCGAAKQPEASAPPTKTHRAAAAA